MKRDRMPFFNKKSGNFRKKHPDINWRVCFIRSGASLLSPEEECDSARAGVRADGRSD